MMAPKLSREEKPIFLSDPVNKDDWKCAVALLMESSTCDLALTRMFSEEAAMEARKEIKSIDFERDLMKILNEYIAGDISYRFAYLLNFSEVFEEAAGYVKNSEKIPVTAIAKIIKAFVFMLRKEDVERRANIMQCNNNPIEIMASKPPVSLLTEKGRRESKGNNDKKKQPQRKTSDSKAAKLSIRIRPPGLTKEDTKLLKRGEQPKDFFTIDDAPQNSFFNLYIVLTGFREPELALEMVKFDIPLQAVFCLRSSTCPKQSSLPEINNVDFEEYWREFLRILWCRHLTRYFSDVVFQLYAPGELPSAEKEIRSFIYREISFLMYDLSDLKHQLNRYLQYTRLWNVDAQEENPDPRALEFEELPYECLNVPIIMQHILDSICGKDGEEECDEEVPSEGSPRVSRSLSSYSSTTVANYESKVSFTSLIPFTSTVKLPTPRWSAVIDNEEKQTLYKKLLALDYFYGLEEKIDESNPNISSYKTDDHVPKSQRLPCENLDAEIESCPDGMLAKFWKNYPKQEKHEPSNKLISRINFPEFMANYLLYILWVARVQIVPAQNEKKSITSLDCENSRTKFTVTDGSRIALQKAFRSKDFFSPSHLKIISPQILTSVSEPQLTPPPKFSWTEKSFISDFHIPAKYLAGMPMGVFEDLGNYMGEEAFSRMKHYDFIEELSKRDLVRRIEDLAPNYDCIRHTYSPLTDSIYVFMYNNPTLKDIRREAYNVMLRTPVGLRDFHDYILDDEREWLNERELEKETGTRWNSCPNSMYNPTPNFRGFTEYDFWQENSIKYVTRANEVLESVIQKADAGRTGNDEKKEVSGERPQSEERYKFVGFDFEPCAIQFSGMETNFKGTDGCSVRVCLQERLYGTQQLGLHVQQGGHVLHLYSFVCPTAHLDEPYTFHVEYKNGTIAAFSRRTFPEDSPANRNSAGSFNAPALVEDDIFAYDMKLSFPHGLTIETIRKHVHPCYLKQSYINRTNKRVDEKSRLFLPNGSVIKFMKNNTVQVLNPDTSIVTASLDDLVLRSFEQYNEESHGEDDNRSQWYFRSYTETIKNGCQYSVVDGQIVEAKHLQIIKKTVMETEERYFRRMDSTRYVVLGNGTVCVEFPDGSKISTSLVEEEFFLGDVWYGEDAANDMYIIVYVKTVMEHPEYATVMYDSRSSAWRILLPNKSEIEVDSSGCHHLHLDGQTELDVNTKAIRMWKYNSRDEFIMSIVADLTVFEKEQQGKYFTAIDSRGKRFVVETDGNCYVTEDDDRSSGYGNQAEDLEPERYFVVRRDLTGFEIVHTENVRKEMEEIGPQVLTFCQELKTTPVTRYFALLYKTKASKKWTVESVTPNTKFCAEIAKTSSTYGKPPSWMHPFPQKKPQEPVPELLEGRILFETKPTDCPCPRYSSTDYSFCDTNHFPESSVSLTDNVPALMRKVADQDQDTLKQIYFAAIRQRAQSNKLTRPRGPELEKYLSASKYHVKLREHLKDSIRNNAITGYFDHPQGMAWLILQTVIEKLGKDESGVAAAPPATQRTESSESSEIEYNLDWSPDPSYSDLSYRSNLSLKTAPPGGKNLPLCPKYLPSPRIAISEPIYKIEDIERQDKSTSYTYRFSLPSSEICSFTEEDIRALEQTSPPKDKEPPLSTYQLQDLMNLGLV